jgi:AraC-like DNA-binding protein
MDISVQVREGLRLSNAERLNEQRLRLEQWLIVVMKNASDHGAVESSAALRYSEIVNVLQAHLHESLSAEEIARLCSMSLSNLKKVFTKYAGMGISRYFTEMKMRHAVTLLQSGMRVGEVAASLGYSDQNYFSTAFRRVMGVPPGQYRK